MRVCVIASCFLVCLAITVLFFTATREGKRISGTDLERLGIDEVMAQVNPIRKLLRPRPHFYVTDAFRQNAYACGRNIVIASDIYGEGLEVAQGVLAHELGHYYHYDTDASLVCHAAVNTVIFPLMLVVLIVRVLSYVPFLGIFAAISGLLVSLFGSLTAFLFRLVNLLFYWVDGKWSERSADIFGVDLGFGTGNYRFLSRFATRRSFVSAIHGFFDVHPGCRNRCRYKKSGS
ncbi:MAG: M48 family metalloprotease [Spirochaetes bacterium]|uniref:M48 family metalloprotease n=1 Tax=Candidatus Aphodenecus pullistercoris TaxID=2840669 RepID=A0A9D9E6T4_9SPIR|nr:M48 family metalloprotease [Candidatus Aphodenecus pullistercoris]